MKGKLITIAYGAVALRFVDTIEKKGLFHFNPGSLTFSFGTTSCNFRCEFCINFSLSKAEKIENMEYFSHMDKVRLAKRDNCQGISFTYNGPHLL
jgi:pyruvate formate lyase activating enzyme